jgi:molecular chaperone DnaK (HSP70)
VNQSEERTADSIGIEVHGGRAIVLIPAGSRIPVARAMTFTTVADGQRAVEVRVVRCDASASCGLSRSAGPALVGRQTSAGTRGRPSGIVGRFLVPGLRNGKRGEARIDIGISLDREGIIRAWGVDRSTGTRQEAAFAGMWALAPEARPRALSALARRVKEELARPEFEDSPDLRNESRLLRDFAKADGGAALAALAGEIDSRRRSRADPPVRV